MLHIALRIARTVPYAESRGTLAATYHRHRTKGRILLSQQVVNVPFTQVCKLDTLRSTMKRKAWEISLLTLPAVALMAIGCTGAGPTAPQPVALASLEGTSWRAEEIDGAGVVDGVQATLIFDAGQKVAGLAACNRYLGTYRQTGDTLEIKPGGMTRMACPPVVMDQETKFLTALGAVRKARREGDTLMLLDDDGRVRMQFSGRTSR